MTFIPDQKPLECHTRIVPNVNGSGVFNEKFTFEINNDDIYKRLCLSVYDYDMTESQMNFQGCLSFGIRNTLRKQKVLRKKKLLFYCNSLVSLKIRGWFYLLQEDIGELRHKQVSNYDEKQVTKINRDIANLEEHQVLSNIHLKQKKDSLRKFSLKINILTNNQCIKRYIFAIFISASI